MVYEIVPQQLEQLRTETAGIEACETKYAGDFLSVMYDKTRLFDSFILKMHEKEELVKEVIEINDWFKAWPHENFEKSLQYQTENKEL